MTLSYFNTVVLFDYLQFLFKLKFSSSEPHCELRDIILRVYILDYTQNNFTGFESIFKIEISSFKIVKVCFNTTKKSRKQWVLLIRALYLLK